MARIALDCDGVLAAFDQGFADIVHRLFPEVPFAIEKWTNWDYGDQLTKAQIKAAWKVIKSTENWWLSLNAYTGVGDLATWLVSRANHDVWICTSRAPSAGMTEAKQTEVWLYACGVRSINNFLGVVTVPKPEDKAKFYEAARIEWSLDDKYETVIECGLIDTFEHKAFLLDQPWNRETRIGNRVKSVGAFLEKIG